MRQSTQLQDEESTYITFDMMNHHGEIGMLVIIVKILVGISTHD
jgi:hypothetical protein